MAGNCGTLRDSWTLRRMACDLKCMNCLFLEFLDCRLPQVTETTESEAIGKGGGRVGGELVYAIVPTILVKTYRREWVPRVWGLAD